MLLNHPSQTKIIGTTLQPLSWPDALAEVDGVALEAGEKNLQCVSVFVLWMELEPAGQGRAQMVPCSREGGAETCRLPVRGDLQPIL